VVLAAALGQLFPLSVQKSKITYLRIVVSLLPMKENEHCSMPDCERPVAATLHTRALCREHFLVACYKELEGATRRLHENSFSEPAAEALRNFLAECTRQAADIAQSAKDLDNLGRARLLDILMWASDLGGRLRRGPRREASLPVRLRSEKPGRPWEEETRTRWLSRHGAMVECEHQVVTGETLQVTQIDTGQQAEARVVWQRRRGTGRFEVGLEFTTAGGFWGDEVSAAEEDQDS
jgi:hypothetical protein